MSDRRTFIRAAAVGVTAVLPVMSCGCATGKKDDNGAEDVGATEDLMREHGVLNRVLLVYEEGPRRLRAKEDIPPEVFHSTAELGRTFVEDYHERLEERYIFPAFERNGTQVELVRVLRRQHEAGRVLTDVILREATGDRYSKEENRQTLVTSCQSLIRTYRPHEAREDTVPFPALRKVLPAREIKNLGE
ncbi:hemerythrin domain-containing protein [bacterium]|nr:hemerythrin domain-containing protein [bacterium]